MNPPILLDTCACHWLIADTLPERADRVLTEAFNAGHPTFVSPITALEVGMLARKRRFKSHMPPQRWFASLMSLPGMALAKMPPELLIESALLPGDIHNDPWDRIIAATAREYGYMLMTRDAALLAYGSQGHLSVFAC